MWTDTSVWSTDGAWGSLENGRYYWERNCFVLVLIKLKIKIVQKFFILFVLKLKLRKVPNKCFRLRSHSLFGGDKRAKLLLARQETTSIFCHGFVAPFGARVRVQFLLPATMDSGFNGKYFWQFPSIGPYLELFQVLKDKYYRIC